MFRKMDYFIGSCSAPLHKCKYIFHKHPCNPCYRIGYGKPCGGSNDCMNDIGVVDEAVETFEALMKEYPSGIIR